MLQVRGVRGAAGAAAFNRSGFDVLGFHRNPIRPIELTTLKLL